MHLSRRRPAVCTSLGATALQPAGGTQGPLWATALAGRLALGAALALALVAPGQAQRVPPGQQAPAALLAAGTDESLLAARDALRRQDGAALALARDALLARQHPLAQWADYWALSNRLVEARQDDLEAFYARWPGSYVEDRLRNDWLLELGQRRDWPNIRKEYPRFRMDDDREVRCYALLARLDAGEEAFGPAREAWLAQRDADHGCQLLATTLREARQLDDATVWERARGAVEASRPRALRAALELLGPAVAAQADAIWRQPERWLNGPRPRGLANALVSELELLALMRLAGTDPARAAERLERSGAGGAQARMPLLTTAIAWGHVARHTSLRLDPQALDHVERAWQLWQRAARPGTTAPWSDEVLAWHARAALRAPAADSRRWPLLRQAVAAMGAEAQADETWVYWDARAQRALAPAGDAGLASIAAAEAALAGIAPRLSFYGKLATEELGQRVSLPAPPLALSDAERAAIRRHAGLGRALELIALGLRSEGVREWNFSLRGLRERELLAAADWACERQVWDRCINTSDRTRAEIDLTQRFPTPMRAEVEAKARQVGIDPAVVFGLIRQESRFIMDARSHVGASGLMQLMPATARWTARRAGIEYTPRMINDRDVNLLLGSTYLKLVLDDFGGSLAMAAAAYNAGPSRPRRWREGGEFEAAAWAEAIPFNETRDYVKKVLSNSVYYAALLGRPVPALKELLGPPVAPRSEADPAPDRQLP